MVADKAGKGARSKPNKAETSADPAPVQLGVFFHPEVRQQLKILAAERGTNMRTLMAEALQDLFIKYGKRPPRSLKDAASGEGDD